jgi:hypothetical protein
MTPEAIEAAAATNEDAASRLASVKEVIRSVVGKALKCQETGDPFSVEDLVAGAAPRAMSIMLARPPAACGYSPPWPSPRYRLPNDRESVNGSLSIGGEHHYDVTCGYYEDGELGEVFVRQEQEGGPLGAMLDALAVVMSIGIQHGVPWAVYKIKLEHLRFDPQGWTNLDHKDLRQVSSVLDFLVKWVGQRVTQPPRLTSSGASATRDDQHPAPEDAQP